MLFEDNDFDINMSLFIPDINFSRHDKLYDVMDGFLRGNSFKDEYKPYKNLTYIKLKETSEKEMLLYKLMAYSFAINDLNLYLDLHPDKKDMFDIFKKYVVEKDKLCKEYEKLYGPLEITHSTGSKYDWIDSPWPWNSLGGNMYV